MMESIGSFFEKEKPENNTRAVERQNDGGKFQAIPPEQADQELIEGEVEAIAKRNARIAELEDRRNQLQADIEENGDANHEKSRALQEVLEELERLVR